MPPVVVLDACVLYPAAQRDLFMWLAAGGAIHAHWTNEIHDEWIRNVERDFGVARSVLNRVRRLMDRAAGDALIDRYRRHEQLFPKTDAKDRHVAAAAVAARKYSGAHVVTIVTWNLADFDRNELTQAGLAAENPDAFLCRLLADSPADTVAAFMRMRDNLRNPAKTTRECGDTLAAQGLKRFARLISAMLD
ncbi:MAG: PIN domain-containing protein [Betaproteobacteria bacterium]|nr:PIN domain-containing protein [Betaproteobacteria bacterium]